MPRGFVTIEQVYKGAEFIVVEGVAETTGGISADYGITVDVYGLGKICGSAAMKLRNNVIEQGGDQSGNAVRFKCAIAICGVLIDRIDGIQIVTTDGLNCDEKVEHPISPFVPSGCIQADNGQWLTGWVYAPVFEGLPRELFLSVDRNIRIPIELNIARPDLNLHTIGGGDSNGFKIAIPRLFQAAAGMICNYRHTEEEETTFELLFREEVLGEVSLKLRENTDGRVEKFENDKIVGWAVDQPQREIPPNVNLFIDGTHYSSTKASKSRSDLRRKGKAERWGGYEFGGLRELPINKEALDVSVYADNEKAPFGGAIKKIINIPDNVVRSMPRAIPEIENYTNVSIIIPVYNAPYELDICVSALVTNTTAPARLLIINDASPDPRVSTILKKWSHLNNIEIHENETNMGFTRTVNRGIELAGDDDVIFLNSDTLVPPRWLEQLSFAAYAQDRIGTVTPLSNNAGAFSIPEANVSNYAPIDLDINAMGRMTAQNSFIFFPAAPTGNGFCMYVRRALLNKVGFLDQDRFPRGYGEENDLCMRGLQAGLKNIIDDRSYVYHKRSASFGDEKSDLYERGRQNLLKTYPEYPFLVRDFFSSKVMTDIRFLNRHALRAAIDHGNAPKPRVLYVIATQTGGTPQTNQDLMNALAGSYDTWVLRCDSTAIFLYKFSGDEYHLKRRHDLRAAVRPSSHRSVEYDKFISGALVEFAFELVHVRHIGWHGIGLLEACKNLEIPVIFSFHDFYTVCPTVKLLDENQNFCGGFCTSGEGPCKAELWPTQVIPPLKHKFVHRWKEMMQSVLSHCDAYVTTADSARKVILDNFPALADGDFRVIPHGRNAETMSQLVECPSTASPIRVLVPGNISAAKGADLYSAISELAADGSIEIHILGDAGRVPAASNVILHGRYKREEFSEHVAKIRPHIGAVFSIWPETYCHTLTEMWMCGIPVAVFDIGAVGERVRAHGAGWLLDVKSSASDLIKFFCDVKSDEEGFKTKLAATVAWQECYGNYYNTHFMALLYNELYADVMARRRTFKDDEGLRSASKTRTYVLADPGDTRGPTLLPTDTSFGPACLQVPSFIPVSDQPIPDPSIIVVTDRHLQQPEFLEGSHWLSLSNISWHVDLSSCAPNDSVVSERVTKFCSQVVGGSIDLVAGDVSTLRKLLQNGLPRLISAGKARHKLGRSKSYITYDRSSRKMGKGLEERQKHAGVSAVLIYEYGSVRRLLSAISEILSRNPSVTEIFVVDLTATLLESEAFEVLVQCSGRDVKVLTADKGDQSIALFEEVLDSVAGDAIWWIGDDYGSTAWQIEEAASFLTFEEVALVQTNMPPSELNEGDLQAWKPTLATEEKACHGRYPAVVMTTDFFSSSVAGRYDSFQYGFNHLVRKAVLASALREVPSLVDSSFRSIISEAALKGLSKNMLVVSISPWSVHNSTSQRH